MSAIVISEIAREKFKHITVITRVMVSPCSQSMERSEIEILPPREVFRRNSDVMCRGAKNLQRVTLGAVGPFHHFSPSRCIRS